MSARGFWISSTETEAELDEILESIQLALNAPEFDMGSPAALRHLATNVISLILALKSAQTEDRE